MYASSVLESWLEDNCTWMHKARRGAVSKLVQVILPAASGHLVKRLVVPQTLLG